MRGIACPQADLVRKLRTGTVVFQFFAAEDELMLPFGGGATGGVRQVNQFSRGVGEAQESGKMSSCLLAFLAQDLWTSDPWALVAALRPGSMPISGERIEGLTLGARVLTQVRMLGSNI